MEALNLTSSNPTSLPLHFPFSTSTLTTLISSSLSLSTLIIPLLLITLIYITHTSLRATKTLRKDLSSLAETYKLQLQKLQNELDELRERDAEEKLVIIGGIGELERRLDGGVYGFGSVHGLEVLEGKEPVDESGDEDEVMARCVKEKVEALREDRDEEGEDGDGTRGVFGSRREGAVLEGQGRDGLGESIGVEESEGLRKRNVCEVASVEEV